MTTSISILLLPTKLTMTMIMIVVLPLLLVTLPYVTSIRSSSSSSSTSSTITTFQKRHSIRTMNVDILEDDIAFNEENTRLLPILLDLRGGGVTPSSSATSASGATSRGSSGNRISSSNPFSWLFHSWNNNNNTYKKSTAQLYRESLEEQVQLLDRQLRQAKDEVITLRERVKESKKMIHTSLSSTTTTTAGGVSSSSSSSRMKGSNSSIKPTTTTTTKDVEESSSSSSSIQLQQQQEERLVQLQRDIKHLEDIKLNLEKLLDDATQKIADLEMKLSDEKDLSIALQTKYERQLESLQSQLEKKQLQQLQKLEYLYEQQIQHAVARALHDQEIKLQQRMVQLTQELQLKHNKELQDEKDRSAKAIDVERKKLRKLVQALAIREQRLLQQQQRRHRNRPMDDDTDNSERKNTNIYIPSSMTTMGQNQEPRTIPTTRGQM